MNTNTIPRRYVMASQSVVRRVPRVMQARGLEPHFSTWVLTSHNDRVWLFGALAVSKLARIERYTDTKLVHHLSTVCNGVPVYLSNTNGLRYGFLLSKRPCLPRSVNFPGCKRGLVRLGIGPTGQPVAVEWRDLGHLLVAGITGAGKSNFLRLLVHQGLAERLRLLLADVDGRTFPMLRDHPALLAPIAGTPQEAHTIVARGLAECDRRAALYDTVPNFPDTLQEFNAGVVKVGGDPLPRILVVLDEYNATAVANGGNRGQFSHDVATLGWRGRKFGLHLVFAAQDFTKAIVGRVRDQVKAAVCFRVRSGEVARNVGAAGANRIPEGLPGRAVTDRWGLLQTYYLDKTLLVTGDTSGILSQNERVMIKWALAENDGYLSLSDIQEHGSLGPREARRLAQDWERRGWLLKDTRANNKRRITGDLAALADKPTNLTNPTNPAQSVQTAVQTDAQA